MTIVPLLDDEDDGAGSANAGVALYGPDDRLIIPFQNENLYAYLAGPDGKRKVSASSDNTFSR